jgi:hypothetical protein
MHVCACTLPLHCHLRSALPRSRVADGQPALTALDPVLLRIAGATLLISAAVEYCLEVCG